MNKRLRHKFNFTSSIVTVLLICFISQTFLWQSSSGVRRTNNSPAPYNGKLHRALSKGRNAQSVKENSSGSRGNNNRIATGATVHDSVVMGSNNVVGRSVRLDEDVVLGNSIEIGRYSRVGASSRIGNHTKIGSETSIDPNVLIDDSVKIGYNVAIGKNTKIGEKATICKNSKIGQNVVIERNAYIGEYNIIEDNSVVKENAVMKNGAHLKKDFVLMSNGEVGKVDHEGGRLGEKPMTKENKMNESLTDIVLDPKKDDDATSTTPAGAPESPPEASSESPTEASSEPPPEASSESPTGTSSEVPTEASSEPPPEASSESPTDASSEPPPEASSEAPPEASSEAPPEASSESSQEASSEPPPEASSESPPEASSESPGPDPQGPPTTGKECTPGETGTCRPGEYCMLQVSDPNLFQLQWQVTDTFGNSSIVKTTLNEGSPSGAYDESRACLAAPAFSRLKPTCVCVGSVPGQSSESSCEVQETHNDCEAEFLLREIWRMSDDIIRASSSVDFGATCSSSLEMELGSAMENIRTRRFLYRTTALVHALQVSGNHFCDRRRLMGCDSSGVCGCVGTAQRKKKNMQMESTGRRMYSNVQSYYCYATSGPCNRDPAMLMPQFPQMEAKIRNHYGDHMNKAHKDKDGCLMNYCASKTDKKCTNFNPSDFMAMKRT